VSASPGRGGYASLACGFALFTVYGSLVPFDFRARSPAEAVNAFHWVLANRVAVESRADALANVLLGVPLGFCTLAALRTDRTGTLAAWLAALVLLPACGAFAAAVEFAQLFVLGRTCSGSDILAQAVGSALGLAAWLTAGPYFTRQLRAAWSHPRLAGRPGHRFLAYCGFVLLAQALPLDIDTSPGDLYRLLRDGVADGRVTVVPFDELADPRRPGWPWAALALVALFLPAGLLLGAIPSRGGVCGAFAVGVVLAGVTEAAQLVVSRHPSTTDLLIGASAVAAGRLTVPVLRRCRIFRHRRAGDTAPGSRATSEAIS
jgi:VanZ family protein